MKVYTSEQMRAQEAAAVAAGTSYEQLMENAGQAVAQDILRRLPAPQPILILCGKGNNGGDGLVIARILAQNGYRIGVSFVCGEELSELSQLNRERLAGLPVKFLDPAQGLAGDPHYIIDGIFGTGFTGALPANIQAILRQVNQAPVLRIALDIPTGLNGDTGESDPDTFQADICYTFAAHKPAHLMPEGQEFCGEIICLNIGID